MAITQSSEKKKKSTGGRKIIAKKKKKYELSNIPTLPTIGKDEKKKVPRRGNKTKIKIKHAVKVNVFDPKTKKHTMTELQTARENPANRNYARRNIITKGAVISTPLGDVKITSRPGQTGSVNAILIEKK